MRVLVAYATRHGATGGIAERIGERLRAAGCEVAVSAVDDAGDVSAYDAFVVGSALYMFHWMKPAAKFVRRNRKVLAARPLWLFSSGPTSDDKVDEQGRDLLEVSGPRELPQLMQTLAPRDHRVFYGASDRSTLGKGLMDRMAAKWMPEGDWRDWPAIETWADGIARELAAG